MGSLCSSSPVCRSARDHGARASGVARGGRPGEPRQARLSRCPRGVRGGLDHRGSHLVCHGQVSRCPDLEGALQDLAGAGLVRPPHRGGVHAARSPGAAGLEVRARVEHGRATTRRYGGDRTRAVHRLQRRGGRALGGGMDGGWLRGGGRTRAGGERVRTRHRARGYRYGDLHRRVPWGTSGFSAGGSWPR